MPIDVVWGNTDRTYVYICVKDEWEWADYQLSITQANAFIKSVDHSVCIVTHLTTSEAQHLPKSAFIQWQKSLKNTPPNLQTVILVPGKPIIRIFLDTAYRMFGHFITFKFRMAATREDAETIVNEILTEQHFVV